MLRLVWKQNFHRKKGKNLKKSRIAAVITVFAVLFIDQASKIWVKLNMFLGQEFAIIKGFFVIHFTENPGMAFGWKWGGEIGKYALTSFRIVAISAIAYYIHKLIKEKKPLGFVITMSLILAGAIGNVIDSFFYGLSFTHSNQRVAELFPTEGGYASFMQGKVVDMLYFTWQFPEWVPTIGGNTAFPYIFNVSDAAITIGVFLILIFQKKFFIEEKKLA